MCNNLSTIRINFTSRKNSVGQFFIRDIVIDDELNLSELVLIEQGLFKISGESIQKISLNKNCGENSFIINIKNLL